MKQTFVLLLPLMLAVTLPASAELYQKDVANAEKTVDNVLADLSPAERQARAAEIKEMRGQLGILQDLLAQRDTANAKLNALEVDLAVARKEAADKQSISAGMWKLVNGKIAGVRMDAERFETARVKHENANRSFKLPAEQIAYDAYHGETKNLALWKSRLETTINVDLPEDKRRAAAAQNEADLAGEHVRDLERTRRELEAVKAEFNNRMNEAGSAFVRVSQALSSGKSSLPKKTPIVEPDESLKDAPNDPKPPGNGSAMEDLKAADRQGKKAKEATSPEEIKRHSNPPFDTAPPPGDIGPKTSTGTAKGTPPATPQTPVAKAKAHLDECTKQADDLKNKLFDINQHPERFKDAIEQKAAMSKVTDEMQTVQDARIQALGDYNSLLQQDAAGPKTGDGPAPKTPVPLPPPPP